MAQLIFWVAAALLVHTYVLYPLSLFIHASLTDGLASLKSFGQAPAPRQRESALPSVTLVVAAYNEASCIRQKVEGSLGLDYPADKLDIVVGSDGSSDGTDEIVRSIGDRRVQLSAAPRGGKVAVLNRCVPLAKGDIVLLTDANTVLEPSAVRRLVSHFEDPEVGAVCGHLKLYNPKVEGYEESAYWRYESAIKFLEGRQGAVVGANGGLYAIRRPLFQTLPPSTIVDDFVIPMRILDRGYRVEYAPDAVAHEETTEDYGKEFGRRTRIAAGNFQSLGLVPGLLSPSSGFRAYAFWSHKVLRWAAPFFMALALAANLLLLGDELFYRVTFAAQVSFYALAFLGKHRALGGMPRKAASAAYYFTVMNFALAVGFWKFLRQSQSAAWERTARA